MTKSRGVGRGGRRSNPGGRPRKPKPETPRELAEATVKEMETILAAQPAPELDELVKTAYQALDSVLKNTLAEPAAKVSAARAVMAEAARRAGGGKTGKKGERAEAARASGVGRFAPPAPPRLVVDNE